MARARMRRVRALPFNEPLFGNSISAPLQVPPRQRLDEPLAWMVQKPRALHRPGRGQLLCRRDAEHECSCPVLKRLLLIALGAVLFLVISGLLARWLSVENVERDADLELVQAQARGDAPAMLRLLDGCAQRPACVAAVNANVHNPRLVRRGAVKILDLNSATAYSISGGTGRTRLAWTVIGTLPVVQCIDVRRTGNPVSGTEVRLLSISPPIPNEAGC